VWCGWVGAKRCTFNRLQAEQNLNQVFSSLFIAGQLTLFDRASSLFYAK
jgi:hypothetical protein